MDHKKKFYKPSVGLMFWIVPTFTAMVLIGLFLSYPDREDIKKLGGIVFALVLVVSFFGALLASTGFVVTTDGKLGFRRGLSHLFTSKYISISSLVSLSTTVENVQSELRRSQFLHIRYIDSNGEMREQNLLNTELMLFSGSTIREFIEDVQKINPEVRISEELRRVSQKEELHRSMGLVLFAGAMVGGVSGFILGGILGHPVPGFGAGALIGPGLVITILRNKQTSRDVNE